MTRMLPNSRTNAISSCVLIVASIPPSDWQWALASLWFFTPMFDRWKAFSPLGMTWLNWGGKTATKDYKCVLLFLRDNYSLDFFVPCLSSPSSLIKFGPTVVPVIITAESGLKLKTQTIRRFRTFFHFRNGHVPSTTYKCAVHANFCTRDCSYGHACDSY